MPEHVRLYVAGRSAGARLVPEHFRLYVAGHSARAPLRVPEHLRLYVAGRSAGARHHHGATWGGSGRRPKLPRPVRAPRRKSANPSGPFGAYAKSWYRYLKDTYPTYRSTDHGRPRDRFTQRTWQPEAVWARWPWANRAHSSGLRRDCPPTTDLTS